MFNIAVVGSGFIGTSHIEAYKKLPNANITAVIDVNAEIGKKVASESGCAYFATLEEAIAGAEIDVVDVCLPTIFHEQFVVAAANAKKHVLCEKPVTFTAESLQNMLAAAKAAGVYFMVGQVGRWWSEFEVIKEYIDAGKLGAPHMIYEKRLAQHPGWTQWHRDPKVSGGGLYDMNIHDIDFLYTLYGKPVKVYATGWKSQSGCWNHVCTNITWASGVQAVCETSLEMTGAFPFSIEFRGTGDDGTLCYSFTAGHNIKDGDVGGGFVWYDAKSEQPEVLSAEPKDMFVGELSDFLAAIERGTEAPVKIQDTIDVLDITLAIKKSLEEGVIVEL